MAWHVQVIESEAGWGQRVDSVEKFQSRFDADEFVSKFNSRNTSKTVPSWYMFATEPYEVIS